MSDRSIRVLKIAAAAYFPIGISVTCVALKVTERDLGDAQTLLMLGYFTLFWPIVLILQLSEWFRKL